MALGFEGVYLFFVLSGFLLTVQTQDQVLGVRTVGVFYARRLLRIFPAVWLQLMVLALVGELWSAWTGPNPRELAHQRASVGQYAASHAEASGWGLVDAAR